MKTCEYCGEIDGYVRKISDYAPTDLKFNSELNKEWYQTTDGISTTALANQKLAAGQSAELTLTLTKAMTENKQAEKKPVDIS